MSHCFKRIKLNQASDKIPCPTEEITLTEIHATIQGMERMLVQRLDELLALIEGQHLVSYEDTPSTEEEWETPRL